MMGHSKAKNRVNFVLMVAAVLPWVLALQLLHKCDPTLQEGAKTGQFCLLAVDHPLRMLNLLFLGAISLLFWILGIIQDSTWVSLLSFPLLSFSSFSFFSSSLSFSFLFSSFSPNSFSLACSSLTHTGPSSH